MEGKMTEKGLSELQSFLLVALIMAVLGVSLKLIASGLWYLGIPIWFLFAFLFFGGWQWLKENKKDAWGYIVSMLIIYLIIGLIAVLVK
jgi:hypothetical protein